MNGYGMTNGNGTRMLMVLAVTMMAATFSSAVTVVSTDPADSATDVNVNSNILVNFDQEMDVNTLTGANVLLNDVPFEKIAGAAVLLPDPAGKQAVLLLAMKRDGVYKITLSSQIRDIHGNSLSQPYTWQFATGSFAEATDHPIRALARFPRMNDFDVPTNVPITVLFTAEMNEKLSGEFLTVRDNVTGQAVAGKTFVKSNRVIFQPTKSLKENTTYEVEIVAGVQAKNGSVSQRSSIWQFTTGQGPGKGPIVTDAWYEMTHDVDGRRAVLHASVENLSQAATDDSGNSDQLPMGYTLKAAIVSMSLVQPVQELSGENTPSMDETKAVPASQPIFAAYTENRDTKNSNGLGEDPVRAKLVKAANSTLLSKGQGVVLTDSGEKIDSGDTKAADGVYSGRLVLGDDFSPGAANAVFAIVAPTGEQTEPVFVPLYIPSLANQ